MYDFRWIDWNIDHIARHGVVPWDAEWVVNRAKRPYPQRIGGGKCLARGQTESGAFLEVIYAIEADDRIFVITARPMTEKEKRQLRRRRK